ncbi:MAG: DUF5320 domain-containing protein [Verrucomicrobia bacterium]|jgi:hypothetical protein|nr:DUF5320 domain-containing protein [Verrucomicrobiota bacterium]MBT7068187.1 DUF5320 domain-containing protein [Verrucomicrobiota bacterium]MBT7701869.1 DUF5320 domain-containing protein [Verrucomicrobiota bacterium]
MPGGDGTGPLAMGPMTGRGAGYCAGSTAPGYASPGPGRGLGRGAWGRGGGRGWGGRRGVPYGAVPPYAAPYGVAPTAEQEVEALREQSEVLAGTLEDIKKRIGDLEAGTQAE